MYKKSFGNTYFHMRIEQFSMRGLRNRSLLVDPPFGNSNENNSMTLIRTYPKVGDYFIGAVS